MKLKPALTQKRIEEIEKLQDGIKTLCDEFRNDFSGFTNFWMKFFEDWELPVAL